jgi:hypothetical protein
MQQRRARSRPSRVALFSFCVAQLSAGAIRETIKDQRFPAMAKNLTNSFEVYSFNEFKGVTFWLSQSGSH